MTVPKRNIYKRIKYQKKMAAAQGIEKPTQPKEPATLPKTPFKRKPRVDHLSRVYQSTLEKQKAVEAEREKEQEQKRENERQKKLYYQEVC
jgi:hypothetical protein